MDPKFFFRFINLGSQGVCFKENAIDEWKLDYFRHDTKKMICHDNASIEGRILMEQMKVETHILKYIICRSTSL